MRHFLHKTLAISDGKMSTVSDITALDPWFSVVLISLPYFICIPKNLQFSNIFYVFWDLSICLLCQNVSP